MEENERIPAQTVRTGFWEGAKENALTLLFFLLIIWSIWPDHFWQAGDIFFRAGGYLIPRMILGFVGLVTLLRYRRNIVDWIVWFIKWGEEERESPTVAIVVDAILDGKCTINDFRDLGLTHKQSQAVSKQINQVDFDIKTNKDGWERYKAIPLIVKGGITGKNMLNAELYEVHENQVSEPITKDYVRKQLTPLLSNILD